MTSFISTEDGLRINICSEDELLEREKSCSDWAYANAMTCYIDGAYWAFSTLTTVGYGDVTSFTNIERVVSVIVMLLGVSFYAFTISNLSSIMANLDSESNNFQRKVEALDEFSRENGLNKELYLRLRRYFEYSYYTNANSSLTMYQKSVLLKEMPSGMRTEVILFIHRNTIDNIPFFNKKDRDCVAEIVQVLQPMEIIAGEYIYKKGTTTTN